MARSCSEDVLSDILCRLRVKSLKRFHCVCKSWYALIRHPSFVTKHLHFHRRHRTFLLSHTLKHDYKLELPTNEQRVTHFSLVHLEESTNDIVSRDWLKFSDNLEQEKKSLDYWFQRIQIYGPRNGIYCLHEFSKDHGDVIALMNVSLREFKLIPKPEESIICHTKSYQTVAEICFDPNTNDYKVFFFKDCNTYMKQGERQAAVYNVSSNSWKKLSDPLLDHVALHACSYEDNTDTYVKGNVHWLATEGDDVIYCCLYILSFDMVREVFARIELPTELRINSPENLYVVAVFNESLSLIVYPQIPYSIGAHESYTICFDIWVMKDYGNERSWTKEFIIGPIEDAYRLLGFWRNGEFLIVHKHGYIISYDPSTKKTEQLCFGEGLYLNKSCIYSESLVSMTGNAPSDYEIVFEDLPFIMPPRMEKS